MFKVNKIILTQWALVLASAVMIRYLLLGAFFNPQLDSKVSRRNRLLELYLVSLSIPQLVGNLYFIFFPGATSVPLIVNTILYIFIIFIGIGSIVTSNLSNLILSVPILLLIMLGVISLLFDPGGFDFTVASINPILLLPFIFKIELINLRAPLIRIVSKILILWNLYIIIASIKSPYEFIFPCRRDKCGILETRIFEGLLGNVIGLVFGFGIIIFAFFISNFRLIVPILTMGTFIALVAGGRGGVISMGTALLAVLIYQSKNLMNSNSSKVFRTILFCAFIFLLISPLVLSSVKILLDRNILWQKALALIQEKPIFGWGPNFWIEQGSLYGNFSYSPHNTALGILVSGGYFALIIIAIIFFTFYSRKIIEYPVLKYLLGLNICLNGLFETTFNPIGAGSAQITMFLLIFVLISYEASDKRAKL